MDTGTIVLIMGIAAAVFGALLAAAFVASRAKCREKAIARVVRIKEEKEVLRGAVYKFYRPVYEYVVDGKKYYAEPSGRKMRKTFCVGDEKEIFYCAQDPSLCRVEPEIKFLVAGIFLMAAGGAIIAICML